LIREGTVDKDEALAYASNPGNLQLRLVDLNGAQPAAPARAPMPPPPPPKPEGSMLDMLER
jgi:twitching motility protein PilT